MTENIGKIVGWQAQRGKNFAQPEEVLRQDFSSVPMSVIKESAQNTLGKIELYAGNFKYGDNNVSSIDQKYTRGHQHILHVTFWSEYDRDSLYMPHPLHIQFGTKWGKYVDEIVVFDVWEK